MILRIAAVSLGLVAASAIPFAPSSAAPQAQAQAAAQAPAATPAPATAGPIPLENFAQLPFFEAPSLSPDGKKVAGEIAIKGKQRFAIIELADTSHVALIDPGDVDLRSWSWVNNDWLVAVVAATRDVEGDSWILSRAVAISADGKKSQILGKDMAAQDAGEILWKASDGTPHILLSLQTSIYSNEEGFWPEVRDFDVSNGRSKRVAGPVPNVMDWYADGAGIVRAGIAYNDDSRSSSLLYRDKQGATFHTIARARGRGSSLGNVPAMFLPEPGKAIAYDDDDGFNALYNLDLATLKTGDKLFGVPGYDLDDLITADDGTRLIGVEYTDTRRRTHWFDPALAEIQTAIDKSVGERRANIVSWSRDFGVMIVWVGGADRPGDYYVFNQADGRMRFLAHVSSTLVAAHYAPVKTIHYKARDGLDISAVLTLPRNKSATKLPLIMMPHGGPFARDDESWDWQAQFLADRGYAVLQPNYRGSSGFGTEFGNKGKGQWGLAMQDDLIDAVKWAAAQGIADDKRVCIVGGSYGGYAALRAAQRDKGVYRCAVSYAGVSDMTGILHYDSGFLNGGRTKDYWRSQADDLKAVSPINFAADFSIPVLLMHGKVDKRVPVKQSREMAERLKAAGKTYRYVEQPTGDHHFSEETNRVQFLKELEAFLTQYNPA
ncbi:S9 family peptidase [Sphingomonas oligophenolica]|uniref:S9 family peptidase n=1 Tax=Sphingomonas oligophenolica TaxID=301154 RepID=A0ABU9XZC2_9SPHN